jgi:hypothetical protein
MRSVFHSANARRLGQLQGWIPKELQGRLMAHHPNHEEYMNQRQAAHASLVLARNSKAASGDGRDGDGTPRGVALARTA